MKSDKANLVLSMSVALFLMGVFVFVDAVMSDDPPKQSISDRINTACPPGFKVTNWEVDGEFTDLPPDIIKVTCVSTDDVKYVAVQR